MTITELYDKLTSVPLFRGISGEELHYIADKVDLRWVKYASDQSLIQADEPCRHLVFLIEGNAIKTTTFDNGTYSVTELIKGPMVIEPEQLYGLTCRYRSDYRALTSCRLLLINKDDVSRTLVNIPIWRINMFNLLTATINKMQKAAEPSVISLKEQIMHFASDNPLTLHIRMLDLGRYLGVSRKTISNALHELELEDKVVLRPNFIEFNK